jgi:acyl transferase domain-containing protein/NADPH:quinone reductase-like Zn-dependent oxidoreductase/aryl carrier-like protein
VSTRKQNVDPGQPIAVVGMACEFPGAGSVGAFWRMQLDGVDATGEVPGDRFAIDEYYDARPRTPGRTITRRGGFLSGIRGFDAQYFGVSGREASHMDPQQRLLLHTAATALQDAGLTSEQLAGSPTAVMVGQRIVDFWDVLRAAGALDIYANAGTARSVLSGRLSYFFDLRGPSVSIDTACSSSLVAVHQACGALRTGEATLALAGGVNLTLTPEESITFSQADMLSADGRCKFGAPDADGFARSDGVGVVVLKTLERAVADGDHIYAVVLGSAVENEGRSSGYLLTPSETAQIDTMRRACQRAGVDPRDVGYVEAHGTGTPTGDPIELRALDAVYGTGAGRPLADPLLVGSVKTNIGHAEAAAGIGGLIKAALCLAHGLVPPSLHSGRLTDAVDWDRLAVEIPQTVRSWGREDRLRYAAVSSFGISGTNAHVVLGEHRPAPTPAPVPTEEQPQPYLLALSAQTPAALRELAQAYADYLGPDGDGRRHELRDVSFSALTRRTHHRHRLALLALEHDQAADQLRKGRPLVATRPAATWKTVFVFPGQGSQWLGMGRRLLRTHAVFREAIEECDRHVRAERGWSVLDQLNADNPDDAQVWPIDVVQPLLWAVEVGLAALWQSWGVTPEVMIGHSMGEVAAACAAGALTLADGAAVICRRSGLLRGIAGAGSMAAVDLPADDLRRELADGPDVSVAVSNSPRRTIISGRTPAVERVLADLTARDIFAKIVKVDVASHSSQVDSLLEALRGELESIRPRKGLVPLRSTVTGELLTGEELTADYWVRNLREEVLFHAAVDAETAGAEAVAFVEISPHPVLGAAVKDCLPEERTADQVVASMLRDTDELSALLTSVGQLHLAGYPVRLDALFDGPAMYVQVPTYPWQRLEFWPEPVAEAAAPGGHPLLGVHVTLGGGVHQWEGRIDLERNAYLLDHQVQGLIILPGTAYVELAAAAAAETIGSDVTVGDIRYQKALFCTVDEPPLVRVTLRSAGPRQWTFDIASASGAADWTRHVHGVIEQASAGERILDGAAADNARQIAARLPEHLTGAEFYRRFAARGNDWRGAFQSVRQLWCGDGEALAEIVVPAGLKDYERHQVHPAVLDACGHTLAATLPDMAVPGDQHAFVLGSIDGFRRHRPLAGKLYSHAVRRDLTAESFSGDICVLDDQGVLLAEIRGLRIRWLLRQEQAGPQSQEETGWQTDWLYLPTWNPVAIPALPSEPVAGAWLVFEDEEIGPHIAPAHGSRIAVSPGEAYERTDDSHFRINPTRLDDYARLLYEVGRDHPDGIAAVVNMWSMRAPRPDSIAPVVPTGLGSTLLLCQALSNLPPGRRPDPRLVLVTRGAQTVTAADAPADPEQAAVWGFGRTAASELPAFRHTLVDLDAAHDPAQARALIHEIAAADPAEDQIALRLGTRYVLRLRRPAAEAGTDDVIELEIAAAGDEVQIAAAYGGVEAHLGWEASGVVTATGANVRGLAVGDRVVALAHPGLATQAVANRHLTHRIPDDLSLADAATLPIAYLTAWYGLMELAALREGEKILIHSAAGGVGLAAVQVARWRGAEIYATAGTEKERTILRMMGIPHVADSRSDFAAPVLAATRGAGIDVILSSLTGAAIDQNLNMLAPYGRYVDLARQEPSDHLSVALRGLPRNASFQVLDIDAFCHERQERAGALLDRILRLVAAGELTPLPAEIYSLDSAAAAFDDMRADRHIGKVLIDLRTPAPAHAPAPTSAPALTSTRIRPDATYLVTGGAGGIGSDLARWLVSRGARHLLLTGRSVPTPGSPAGHTIAALLNELRSQGADVQYAPVDAADEHSMRRLIEYRRTAGHPTVRGVFHTAGVFTYQAIGDTTLRDLETVLRPKLEGGRVLDRLFDNDDLDYFVLFSSGNALLASPQVATGATANAGLDAIARARRRHGRPALSVNWGFWTDCGMVAKAGADLGRSLIPRGMTGFSSAAGLAVLDHLLATNADDTIVMPVDWAQWQAAYPTAASSPLLRDVVNDATRPHLSPQPASSAELPAEPKSWTTARDLPTPPAATPAQASPLPQPTPPAPPPPADPANLFLTQVAAILRTAPDHLDPDRDLTSQGLDSLMAAQLRREVQRSNGTLLPISKILSHATLNELTAYLSANP